MRQAERRAQTSERLLDAAAEVFARRGFHATTLDEVAAAAGYSKGAVYSNFAGKDALFLALVDRHLDLQLEAIEQLAATTSGDALRGELLALSQAASSSGSFGLLMLEFWLHAARNEAVRAPLTDRYAHPHAPRRSDRNTLDGRPPVTSTRRSRIAGACAQHGPVPAAAHRPAHSVTAPRATAVADVIAPASP